MKNTTIISCYAKLSYISQALTYPLLVLIMTLVLCSPVQAAERRKEKKTAQQSRTSERKKKTQANQTKQAKAKNKKRTAAINKGKSQNNSRAEGRTPEREHVKQPVALPVPRDTTPKVPAARFTPASLGFLLGQVAQNLRAVPSTGWQQLIGREGIELKLGNERNRYAAEQAPKAMAILSQSYALGAVVWVHKGITPKGLAYGLGKVKATLRSGTGSGKNTDLTLYVVAKAAGDSLNPRAELLKLAITE